MNQLQIADKEAGEELGRLKSLIREYDDGFRRAYKDQMGYAFLCGVALNRAKDVLPHGKFLPWVESEVGVTRMSAGRYRKLADAIIEAYPAVGKCSPVLHLNSGGGSVAELTKEECDEVVKAVHDISDGKSLTEMYRDLGVIRQPEPYGARVITFHCRACPPRTVELKGKLGTLVTCPKCKAEQVAKPDKQTAEEERKAAAGMAEDLFHSWTSRLRIWLAGLQDPNPAPWVMRVTRAMRQEGLDLCIQHNELIRATFKAAKPAQPAKKKGPKKPS